MLADGSLLLREQPVDAAAVVARAREQDPASDAPAVRLVPDRNLPAATLLALAADLRDAGAGDVWLVTEKGLE